MPTEPGCSIISLEVSLPFGSMTLSTLSLTALPLYSVLEERTFSRNPVDCRLRPMPAERGSWILQGWLGTTLAFLGRPTAYQSVLVADLNASL